jgi:hypothetical protein
LSSPAHIVCLPDLNAHPGARPIPPQFITTVKALLHHDVNEK